MRRIVLTYIFLSVIGIWGAMAQNTLNPMNNRDRFGNQIDPNTQPDNLEDSTNTEIQSLPPKLYMWKLSETLGNRTSQPQLPEHQSGGRNVRPLQLLGKFRFSTSLTSVLRTGGKRTYHLHGSLLQFFHTSRPGAFHQQQRALHQSYLLQGRQQSER